MTAEEVNGIVLKSGEEEEKAEVRVQIRRRSVVHNTARLDHTHTDTQTASMQLVALTLITLPQPLLLPPSLLLFPTPSNTLSLSLPLVRLQRDRGKRMAHHITGIRHGAVHQQQQQGKRVAMGKRVGGKRSGKRDQPVSVCVWVFCALQQEFPAAVKSRAETHHS